VSLSLRPYLVIQLIIIYHIRTGEPCLSEAAADAVTHLVSEGSPTERQALIEAGIFTVAVNLYNAGSERRLSLKLLHIIIQHLIHLIIIDEQSTIELLCLFESVCMTTLE
jgi:hypothetical protein